MISLTPTLAAALRALQVWQAHHGAGVWPGWRRVQVLLGMSSSEASRVLHALEDRGRIVIARRRAAPGCRWSIDGLHILGPLPVSRAPDGAALHFVPAPRPAPRPAPPLAEAA